jgi:hypothetical protein
LITLWYDRNIMPGRERAQETATHLDRAQIILLLISPDFLASERCRAQMRQALEKHTTGTAQALSILLHPTASWKRAPFAHLPILPRRAEPVTTWHKQELALSEIAEEICALVEYLQVQRQQRHFTYRHMREIPTPPHPRAIILREHVVQDISALLTQVDVTAVALTGIVGVGKTTLADLVYHHAKAQQQAGQDPFKADPLKIKISPATTMEDIVASLYEILGQPQLDLRHLAAETARDYLAMELFDSLPSECWCAQKPIQ